MGLNAQPVLFTIASVFHRQAAIAKELGGLLLKYPSSDLFRLMRDEDGLQLDFMATIHGIRSFEGLAPGRAKDRAVLEILEKTLDEKEDIAQE